MILGVGFIAFVAGALWRRLYGGAVPWITHPICLVAATLFVVPAAFCWPWWAALAVYGLIILQFTPGERFDEPSSSIARYGYVPLLLALWLQPPTPILIALVMLGPLFGAAHALLLYFGTKEPIWPPFIDGWGAYWELLIGGVSMAMFSTLPFLVAVR
jgi:hypothetical protein